MAIFEVQVKTTQLFVDSFKVKDNLNMKEAKKAWLDRFSRAGVAYNFVDVEQKIHIYPTSSIVSITITPVEDV